jgi:hypothetical protein
MATDKDILCEKERARRLRFIVDFTKSLLYQTNDGLEYDYSLIDSVRKNAQHLFPNKEKTFFLIYFPRLRRVLVEKYGIEAEYYDHPLNIKFEEYFGGANENAN